MSRTRIVALALALVAATAPVHAQKLEEAPMPIEVAATPTRSVPQGPITLSGRAIELAKQATVTLTFKAPSGKIVTRSARLDGNGSYSLVFSEADELGKWQVTATAPDGKATAEASFDIVGAGEMQSELTSALDVLVEVVAEEVPETWEDIIETLPPIADDEEPPTGPPDAGPNKGPNKVRQAGDKLREGVKDIAEATKQLNAIDLQCGGCLEIQEDIVQAREQVKGVIDQIKDKIREVANWPLCKKLDFVPSVLGYVGDGLSFIKGGFLAVLQSKLKDERTDAIGKRVFTDPVKQAWLRSAVKVALAVVDPSPAGKIAVAKLFVDEGKVLAYAAMDKYCQRFEGKVKAIYDQDLLTGGKPFWSYQMVLDGNLKFYFDKNATGPEIPVTGDLTGSGTRFTLQENLVLLDRRVISGIVARKVWPFAGRYARFSIPVTGKVKGKELSLVFSENATYDFVDTVDGKVMYIYMAPSGLARVEKASLPYRKAAWIINRGTNGDARLVITPDAANQVTRVRNVFRRNIPQDTFRVNFEIDLKACSPTCPE